MNRSIKIISLIILFTLLDAAESGEVDDLVEVDEAFVVVVRRPLALGFAAWPVQELVRLPQQDPKVVP